MQSVPLKIHINIPLIEAIKQGSLYIAPYALSSSPTCSELYVITKAQFLISRSLAPMAKTGVHHFLPYYNPAMWYGTLVVEECNLKMFQHSTLKSFMQL